jgi:hypothetical protein
MNPIVLEHIPNLTSVRPVSAPCESHYQSRDVEQNTKTLSFLLDTLIGARLSCKICPKRQDGLFKKRNTQTH